MHRRTTSMGRRRAEAERPVRAARPAVALLEVVLALALFFGVAVAILGGLSACVKAAREVRLEAHAADLAVTMLSELQMGLVPVADSGPTAYEDPDAEWTWQLVTAPVPTTIEGTELTNVEVIIRHTAEGYTFRLCEWLPAAEEESPAGAATSGSMAAATPSAEGGQP